MKQADFEASRAGLRKILERRGKEFAVIELIQNAFDEAGVSKVSVVLEPLASRPVAHLRVEDDSPTGFRDLSHGYTLFADSHKRKNAELRGRFNLGEKLVVALCSTASLSTTTGTIEWDDEGRTVRPRKKRERGTVFEAEIRMTRADVEKAIAAVMTIFPPDGVELLINGSEIIHRSPVRTFDAVLQTEDEDEEGRLRPTRRKTKVRVFEPLPGETPMLYELGLPVVAIEDRWHYDIAQKVPVTLDRAGLITPAFLRTLRALVLNAMATEMTPDDAAERWVDDALEDPKVSPEAVKQALTLRFGSKHVVHDPSDREANDLAKSQGYTVIPPRALSKAAWDNVRKFEATKPAGQVTPSAKAYEYGLDGRPIKFVPPERWTSSMANVAAYCSALHQRLIGEEAHVRMVNEPGRPFSAAYCRGTREIHFNVARLGYRWFDQDVTGPISRLLIHEFGHFFEGNHLSVEYHEALCMLGTRLLRLALDEPSFFPISRQTSIPTLGRPTTIPSVSRIRRWQQGGRRPDRSSRPTQRPVRRNRVERATQGVEKPQARSDHRPQGVMSQSASGFSCRCSLASHRTARRSYEHRRGQTWHSDWPRARSRSEARQDGGRDRSIPDRLQIPHIGAATLQKLDADEHLHQRRHRRS